MMTYEQAKELHSFLPPLSADLEIGRGLTYARRGAFQHPLCVAWSLDRLLELMPEKIGDLSLKMEKWYNPYAKADRYSLYYEDMNGFTLSESEQTGGTLTEAACKMIIWLKENNHLELYEYEI